MTVLGRTFQPERNHAIVSPGWYKAREIRVQFYSLPLKSALLSCGQIHHLKLYKTFVCLISVSPVDVGAAVPARADASTRTELQVADAALQVPGCRECLGPLPEARRDEQKNSKPNSNTKRKHTEGRSKYRYRGRNTEVLSIQGQS